MHIFSGHAFSLTDIETAAFVNILMHIVMHMMMHIVMMHIIMHIVVMIILFRAFHTHDQNMLLKCCNNNTMEDAMLNPGDCEIYPFNKNIWELNFIQKKRGIIQDLY